MVILTEISNPATPASHLLPEKRFATTITLAKKSVEPLPPRLTYKEIIFGNHDQNSKIYETNVFWLPKKFLSASRQVEFNGMIDKQRSKNYVIVKKLTTTTTTNNSKLKSERQICSHSHDNAMQIYRNCNKRMLSVSIVLDRKKKRHRSSIFLYLQPRDAKQTIQLGDYLFLVTRISGQPAPTVTWFRNNVPIKCDDYGNSTESDLQFKCSREDDDYLLFCARPPALASGVYSCRAVNEFGEALSQATVVIEDNVHIVTKEHQTYLTSHDVNIGKSKPAKESTENNSSKLTTWNENKMDTVKVLKSQMIVREDHLPTTLRIPPTPIISKVKAPKFVEALKDVITYEDGDATFHCVVSGSPKPDVAWFINGAPLEFGGRIKVEELVLSEADFIIQQTISIHNVTKDDAADVSAVISNSAGRASASATLRIKSKSLKFLEKPNNVVTHVDGRVTFKCIVLGSPTPNIKWRINGRPLKFDDRIAKEETVGTDKNDVSIVQQTIVITRVTSEDEGEVKVMASNLAGEIDASCMLIAKVKSIKFLQELEDVTAFYDDSASLTCVVCGLPKPDIIWLLNGQPVFFDSRISLQEKINEDDDEVTVKQTLVLKKVSLLDDGDVKVVAWNAANQISARAKLNVKIKSLKFLSRPSDVKAYHGDEAVFSCIVSGFPRPDLKWHMNGQLMKFNERMYLKEEVGTSEEDDVSVLKQTIFIEELIPTDGGEVQVVATNQGGSVEATCFLVVKEKFIKFLRKPADCSVDIEDDVQFSCIVSGSQQPNVTWYHNGSPMKFSDRIKQQETVEEDNEGASIVKQVVVVSEVTAEDEGEFQVVASSVAGRISASASLNVKAKSLMFLERPADVTTYDDENVAFACAISGYPRPNIDWFLNGKPITDDKRISMDEKISSIERNLSTIRQTVAIKKVTVADAGDVRVVASNSAGKVFSAAKLTVQACDKKLSIQHILTECEKYNQIRRKLGVPSNVELLFQNRKTKSLEFLNRPTDVVTYSGSSACISCVVSGSPKPVLRWTLNKEPIEANDRISLEENVVADHDDGKHTVKHVVVIRKLRPEDSGEVGVDASNSSGDIHASSLLTVKAMLLEFLEKPKSLSTYLKDCANFNCIVSGSPEPRVYWLINGKPVEFNERILIEETVETDANDVSTITHKITIKKVSSEDVGEVQVVASNLIGKLIETCNLATKATSLEFIEKPKNQGTFLGEDATFSCVVSGAPRPQLHWLINDGEVQFNDRILIKETVDTDLNDVATVKQRVTIKKVTEDDVGNVQVVATNLGGRISEVCNLKVKAKSLEFVEKPKNVTAYLDEGATFNCVVSGSPKPDIQWLMNSEPVVFSDRILKKETVETDLNDVSIVRQMVTIKRISPGDVGTIEVVASNFFGKLSESCRLTAKIIITFPIVKSLEFLEKVKNVTTYFGEDASFSSAVSGSPRPDVHWLINGRPVILDNRILIKETVDTDVDDVTRIKQKITIKNVKAEDGGEVQVVASNLFGKLNDVCNLIVKVKSLEIVEKPKNVTTFIEEDATFSCVVTGSPKPDVQWTINGRPVVSNDRILIEETVDTDANDVSTIKQKLTIKKVSSEDVGKVQIAVSNLSGKLTEACDLKIKTKSLKFLKKPTNARVYPDEEATFSCAVSGSPKPDLHWLINGKPVQFNDRILMKETIDTDVNEVSTIKQRITIRKVIPEDGGNVQVVAYNIFSEISETCNLSVKENSISFVEKPVGVTVSDDDRAVFSCVVSGYPKPNIFWTLPSREKMSIEDTTLDETVDTDEEGRFTIKQVTTIKIKKVAMSGSSEVQIETSNSAGKLSCCAPFVVRAKSLKFVSEPSDVTTYIDENASYSCSVMGYPKPIVDWQLNGKQMTFSDRINMEESVIIDEKDTFVIKQAVVINKIISADEGKVRVVASNSCGKIFSAAKLTLKKKSLKFVEKPADATCYNDGEVSFKCIVSGYPKPIINWTLSDRSIVKNDRIALEETTNFDDDVYTVKQVITIKNVATTEAGKIRVVASNSVGNIYASSSMSVKGEKYLEFLEKPTNARSYFGKDATFSCVVSGSPRPVLYWSINGKPLEFNDRIMIKETIDTDTNDVSTVKHKITIKKLDPKDLGEVQVVASNLSGKLTEVCSLMNKMKLLEFVEKPENVSTLPDDEATLQCVVLGSPKPDVHWLLNGKALRFNERILIKETIDTDANEVTTIKQKIFFKKVSLKDGGEIQVVASNLSGKLVQTCSLAVKEKLLNILEIPSAVTACDNDFATFTCTVSAYPRPDFDWLLRGNPMKFDERIVKEETIDTNEDGTFRIKQKITINEVRSSDAGDIQVVVSNAAGKISKSAPLVVKVKSLKFLAEPTDIRAYDGDNAPFSCFVSGYPKPELIWRVNGQLIKYNERIELKEEIEEVEDVFVVKQRIVIKNVAPTDEGEVQVVASNSTGNSSASSSLIVKVASIEFLKKPTDLTTYFGDGASFECIVSGLPMPNIQWFINGSELKFDGRRTKKELIETDTNDVFTVKQTVFINEVTTEDVGEVQVVASNSFKNTQTFCILKAKEKLIQFLEKPLSSFAYGGDEVKFNCVVMGHPKPSVEWLLHGRPMKFSDRIKQHETVEEDNEGASIVKQVVVVSEVTAEDEGELQIVASNLKGTLTATASLNVKEKLLKFLERLVDATVYSDDDATFTCVVLASPKPLLNWHMNGKPLKSNDRITIVEKVDINNGDVSTIKQTVSMKKVSPNDAGEVQVVASNAAGNISTSSLLTVKVKSLKFLESPNDVTAYADHNATFSAVVSGQPKPVLHWLLGGQPIKFSDRIILQESTGADRNDVSIVQQTIVITKVAREDEGEVKVVASNLAGKIDSSCKLRVKVLSIKFLETPSNVTLCSGHRTSFGCIVSGYPKPDVAWLHCGRPMKFSDRIKQQETVEEDNEGAFIVKQVVVVREVTAEDEGELQVVASNLKGILTANASLNVKEKFLKFVRKPDEVTATEGDDVELSCVVSGYPRPLINWLIDEKPVQYDNKISRKEQKVTDDEHACTIEQAILIKKIAPTDSGKIQVVASNSSGEISTFSTLVVRAKSLKFCEKPGDITAHINQNATISCIVAGYPRPDIVWSLNDRPLKFSDRIILQESIETDRNDVSIVQQTIVITKVTAEDEGEVKVVASNLVGKITAACKLFAKEVTLEFLEGPTDKTAVDGDRVEFNCSLSAYPRPDIIWQHRGRPMEFSDRIKRQETVEEGNEGASIVKQVVVISEVTAEDEGVVEVFASNSKEIVISASALLNVKIKALNFLEEPLDVTSFNGDDATFTCVVSGYPKPLINWHVNGRKIKFSDKITLEEKVDTSDENVFAIKQTVVIKKITPSDAGEVQVVASNSSASISSSSSLTVKIKSLQFLEKPNDVSSFVGQCSTVSCVVSGYPKPNTKWLLNGQPLKFSDRILLQESMRIEMNDITIVQQTVVITKITAEDKGEVKVVASNLAGDIDASCILYVKDTSINFLVKPVDMAVESGDDVDFICVVSGFPRPDVKWFAWLQHGQTIKLSDRVKLHETADLDEEGMFIIKHTATYKNVTAEDAGEVQVVASSSAGKIFAIGKLEVKVKSLKFIQEPTNVTAYDDDDAVFICVVSGYPRAFLEWQINEKPIIYNDRINMEEKISTGDKYECTVKQTVVIKKITPSDAGEIQVVASNSSGKLSKSSLLRVKVKSLKFLEKPGDMKVYTDHVATISCVLSGSPKPDLLWLLNGRPIKFSDRIIMQESTDTDRNDLSIIQQTIVITKVTTEDEGEVQVVASNLAGKLDASCKLIVKEMTIMFMEKPIGLTVTLGSQATFICKVSGLPKPDICWLYQGRLMKFSDRIKQQETVEEDNGGAYIVKQVVVVSEVTAEDEGEFQVVASNLKGEISARAILNVKVGSLKCLKKPNDVTAYKDDNATFSCIVSGHPKPIINWEINGRPIKYDDRISKEEKIVTGDEDVYTVEQTIVITKITPADAGLVQVVASNSSGNISVSSILTVHVKSLKFLEKPENVISFVGESATFGCSVSGLPRPDIRWLLNGQAIELNDRISKQETTTIDQDNITVIRHAIVINKLTSADEGKIQIVASNLTGKIAATATLNVKMKSLQFLKNPSDATVYNDDYVAFNCLASGSPKPIIDWQINNNQIKTDDRIKVEEKITNVRDEYIVEQTLIIKKVTVADAGRVEVVASNSYETISTSCSLTVVVRVKSIQFVEKPKDCLVDANNRAIFHCIISGYPKPDIKWLANGRPIKFNDRIIKEETIVTDKNDVSIVHQTIVITNVTADDEGEVQVVASNLAGDVAASCSLIAKRSSLEFLTKPSDLRVFDGDSARFVCVVSGHPKPYIEWKHKGSLISFTDDISLQEESEVDNEDVFTIKQTLIFDKATASSAGEIEVMVTNIANKLSATAKLSIEDYFDIFEDKPLSCEESMAYEVELANLTVQAGQNADFVAKVTGKPIPKIQWFKNDEPLEESSRIRITNSGREHRLQILNVNKDDVGVYRVRSYNGFEELSSCAELAVTETEISTQRLSTTKFDGDVVFEMLCTKYLLHYMKVPIPNVKTAKPLQKRWILKKVYYGTKADGEPLLSNWDASFSSDYFFRQELNKQKVMKEDVTLTKLVARFQIKLNEASLNVGWFRNGDLLDDNHPDIHRYRLGHSFDGKASVLFKNLYLFFNEVD
ncbi:hypothetical protein HELRODRAFT_164811 [Helobdella robusta]|uniref:Ig-like domain-containing protein n=1 Tax=Helobdella robusta TaxID=6412 RepID=T1EVU3_HELRO|nr:hypothetical protein HELRODRAFT_164811 [Helobdella robusta]ESN92715.1 hypothetical protein HELRODRAFT_164811 [Helobdella robusta]